MSLIWYGRKRKELVNVVEKIVDEDGRVTPFGRIDQEKIDSKVSLRTTLQLGKKRAVISAEKIQHWFSDLDEYVRSKIGEQDILKDSSRLYNADESSYSLCSTGNQVVGYRGALVVYHYGNSSKFQLTVMAAASATWHYVPPMIIFPGQRFSYNHLEGFEEAATGLSDTGWMDAEVFCEWLKTVFIPAIDQRNVKKPVILSIDGHTTHTTLDASDFCIENGIELYTAYWSKHHT